MSDRRPPGSHPQARGDLTSNVPVSSRSRARGSFEQRISELNLQQERAAKASPPPPVATPPSEPSPPVRCSRPGKGHCARTRESRRPDQGGGRGSTGRPSPSTSAGGQAEDPTARAGK
jgi:hypothetical protein